jgi:hypothetical protein
MARRQLQIVGTERTDIPPELVEAGEKMLDLRREKRRVGEKAKEAKFAVILLMQSNKIPSAKFTDPETKEFVDLSIDLEPKLRIKRSGEADTELGESDEAATPPGENEVRDGLIAQAERAMAENGVVETPEGDVAVPDTAAPKKPRKGAGKKRGK